MATLQPYQKYYPIAYDYATQLPEGWQLLPNIAIFQERIERGHINEELLSVTIGRGVIRQTDVDIKKDSSNEDKSKYKLIKVGDIAYNKMRMWQGALGYSDYQGISSPAYVILKPKMEINPRYFHYMFRTSFYTNYSKRFSYGIVDDQLSLRYTDFKRMYSIVPPLSVQNSIVAYLDKKNNEIDKFIRNKERLIEIILERQENEISNIITKGLNKSEFKDSESKWIGKIPTDWNLIPLGYLLKYISYGFTNPMPTTDEGPFMLTANDVGDGEIYFDTCRRTSEKEFKKLSNKSIPRNGDILVTKDGTLGRTSIFNGEKSCINQSVALLRVSPKYTSGIFIETVLRSKCYQDKMIYDAEGTTIKHIYITKLVKMKIALPDINEQEEIIKTIDSIRNENRNAIEKISKEISSIKEYREALITDLVTGKRSVPQLQMS
jgi:type I restriction enzyme S subunit